MSTTRRPTSVTIFGVLNIVFGGLSVLGTTFSLAVMKLGGEGADPMGPLIGSSTFFSAWTKVGLVLGFVVALGVIAAGIGLLKMQRWARVASVGYGVYSLVMGVAGLVLTWFFVFSPMLEQMAGAEGSSQEGAVLGAIVGGLVGGLAGLLYPAVLLYFMTRPGLIRAFEGTSAPAAEDWEPPAPADVAAAEAASPYAPPAAPLEKVSEGSPRQEDELLVTVIPVRNKPALISYYLGLFSVFALVPLVGILGVGMAVAALVLGLKGRKVVRENPSAKGTVHAWIGILGGILWGVLGVLMQGVIVYLFLRS